MEWLMRLFRAPGAEFKDALAEERAKVEHEVARSEEVRDQATEQVRRDHRNVSTVLLHVSKTLRKLDEIKEGRHDPVQIAGPAKE